MKDSEFYQISEGDRNRKSTSSFTPKTPAPTAHASPIDVAKQESKSYKDDGKIYIVRGEDLFVIDSADIHVTRPVNGLRTITIKKAKMLKYSSDGTIQTDD